MQDENDDQMLRTESQTESFMGVFTALILEDLGLQSFADGNEVAADSVGDASAVRADCGGGSRRGSA